MQEEDKDSQGHFDRQKNKAGALLLEMQRYVDRQYLDTQHSELDIITPEKIGGYIRQLESQLLDYEIEEAELVYARLNKNISNKLKKLKSLGDQNIVRASAREEKNTAELSKYQQSIESIKPTEPNRVSRLRPIIQAEKERLTDLNREIATTLNQAIKNSSQDILKKADELLIKCQSLLTISCVDQLFSIIMVMKLIKLADAPKNETFLDEVNSISEELNEKITERKKPLEIEKEKKKIQAENDQAALNAKNSVKEKYKKAGRLFDFCFPENKLSPPEEEKALENIDLQPYPTAEERLNRPRQFGGKIT